MAELVVLEVWDRTGVTWEATDTPLGALVAGIIYTALSSEFVLGEPILEPPGPQDSTLMEAEEPPCGALAPVPAGAEFSVSPAAPRRGSQAPALELEAEEGEGPSDKWAQGHTLLETPQREGRDVNDYAAEGMTSVPQEASADVESRQEDLMAAACDTPADLGAVPQSPADRDARTPTPPEPRACPDQGERLDNAPIPSELGSSVEVESGPELTSLILGPGQAEGKEDTHPDTSAQTSVWPSWEEHLVDTRQPQDPESGAVRQESPGGEGPRCLQEAEGLEERGGEDGALQGEGALGEDVCSDGLSGDREQMGRQVNGADADQRPQQEQVQELVPLAGPGEREGHDGELGGQSYGESPGQEAAQNNQQEESEPGKETASSPGAEVVPASASVTPPRTPESAPSSPSEGIPTEGSRGQAAGPSEGSSKHKDWHRQGLRRASILPEGPAGAYWPPCGLHSAAYPTPTRRNVLESLSEFMAMLFSFPSTSVDTRSPAMEKSLGLSDAIVFREKKPKEVTGGFSRRCSKLINSSQLLYQEYSDVFLNKEIQSQQRLDSLTETPGLVSPRQPRKSLVPSESYLQRLSMASSGSLWQEIPAVRNSAVLLSMTHEDQKLQEAKFELIVSEASYLRSLHIAVDHFQHSEQLRAILSNQDHQWLFSRLQDVRDVSTMFLSDLEENFENNIFTFQVCDVVLNHAPNFRRVYLPYVTNQTYQERTFQTLLNSNSSFREVLEKLESDPVCQRLSLKSFLILPFQRITRLKLLLQNILKRTQPGSSEEAEATKAHHALEELIRDCNSNVQRMRRTEELIYLSQKIEFECKIFPLISQSRWLVKSGELIALEFSISPGLRRKLNTRPVHLHLFNDCLLLSRPREGSRFLVFDHAPFSSIRVEKCEMKLHGPHKNLFRLFLRHNVQGTRAEFLFRTETQSEKLRWISALAMPREELDLLECYDSPQVQCLRAYKPRENDELALEKADVVMVTQQSSDGWLEGVRLSDGEQGWFPVQQVEFISNPEVRARNLKEAHRVKTAKLQLVEQQP
ncbi:rho guanine nucleotide exchange factor 5 [Camelus ferus]|nr:rho guanine nucleotide exchange factor 5 [Camelus ferus]